MFVYVTTIKNITDAAVSTKILDGGVETPLSLGAGSSITLQTVQLETDDLQDKLRRSVLQITAQGFNDYVPGATFGPSNLTTFADPQPTSLSEAADRMSKAVASGITGQIPAL